MNVTREGNIIDGASTDFVDPENPTIAFGQALILHLEHKLTFAGLVAVTMNLAAAVLKFNVVPNRKLFNCSLIFSCQTPRILILPYLCMGMGSLYQSYQGS